MTAIEWRETSLGDIVNIRRGITWKREQEAKSKGENTIPVLRIPNIKQILDTSDLLFIRGVTESHRAKYAATKNWILMVGSNGNPERVGNCVFIDEDNEYLFASFLLGIESKDCEQIDPKYLFRLIGGPLIQRSISDAVQGSTGLKNISLKMLRQEFVKIPPLPEQKKITAILSSVDDAIQATQAVIDQTRRVKQGLMQQLLTRGIEHTRFKQTEIGEIPEEWDVVQLSEIASHERSSFANGPFGSNLLKSDLRTTGVPVIYIRDIKTAIYNPVKQVYVDKDKADELSSCEVLPEDILITKVGNPPGIASIYPKGCERAIVTQDVIRLRINRKKCQPEFVRIVINSPLGCTLIENISIEGTRKRMALGTFKKIPFPFPTLPEQKQITKAITLTENTIIEEQRKLNCFQHVKRGLMQDLLTGRMRVKLSEEATT